MADQGGGGIAWTEQTWNPVRGCSRVSEGCRHCYAETVAARFSKPGMAYAGLAKSTSAGPRWTGVVRMVEEHLLDPLRWTRPRRVFVNSMSDLFHESLSVADVAKVFAVMYLAHRHTFQVLTKRAARMRELLTYRPPTESFYRDVLDAARLPRDSWPGLTGVAISDPTLHPHRNVWLGVSVEDQAAANERIPDLIQTPAAVRWLSIEPQLGPVDLDPLTCQHCGSHEADTSGSMPWCARCDSEMGSPGWLDKIDWVVIGGESGAGARPFDIQWARDLVKQCQAAGVAVFVKQLGTVPTMLESAWRSGPSHLLDASTRDRVPAGYVGLQFTSKGGDPAEWPVDLRVREYPEARP